MTAEAYDPEGSSDLAHLFDTNGNGNNTYTDSELHELLGFVETMENAATPDERALTRIMHHPPDRPGRARAPLSRSRPSARTRAPAFPPPPNDPPNPPTHPPPSPDLLPLLSFVRSPPPSSLPRPLSRAQLPAGFTSSGSARPRPPRRSSRPSPPSR